jgi:hypothetical protein
VVAADVVIHTGSNPRQVRQDGVTLGGVQIAAGWMPTDEQQGAGFVRDSLEWVREPEALASTMKSLYGENVVRQSSDPIANAKAAAAGATIIPGRWFNSTTRSRLDRAGIMPTSHERFGGAESVSGFTPEVRATVCQACGGTGLV